MKYMTKQRKFLVSYVTCLPVGTVITAKSLSEASRDQVTRSGAIDVLSWAANHNLVERLPSKGGATRKAFIFRTIPSAKLRPAIAVPANPARCSQ